MKEIIKTNTFDRWLKRLRDNRARGRIVQRIDRLQAGNAGNVKPVGEGVSELKIDYGPGYRIYYIQDGPVLIILLSGGDKSSQDKDIGVAKKLARQWRDEK